MKHGMHRINTYLRALSVFPPFTSIKAWSWRITFILLLVSFVFSVYSSPISAGDDDNQIENLPPIPEPVKKHPKLASDLADKAEKATKPKAPLGPSKAVPQTIEPPEEKVKVIIEVEPGKKELAIGAIQIGGGQVETTYENMLQVNMPVSSLTAIADHPNVRRIRKPARPVFDIITSQGVFVTGANLWGDANIKGQGVKIAVLDSGFQGYASLLGTELPSSVTTKSFRADQNMEAGSKHGTGIAEIIYDIAPAAQFYLVNFGTFVEMGNAVDWLIAQNVNIISHSVGWPGSGTGDGTGPANDIVTKATNAGILWVNAAGNSAQQHWGGTWVDNDNDTWLDFTPTDEGQTFSATAGSIVEAYLTWDDPWGSATNDYDLYLRNSAGTTVASSTYRSSLDGIPEEEIYYPVTTTDTYYFSIRKYTNNKASKFNLFTLRHSLQYVLASGSVTTPPADSSNALSVGAVAWNTPTTLETYSSQGPTTDGRIKPDIVAPTGVSTFAYSPNPFYGTSASAPHVSAAAALVKQANPSWTPAQIKSFLESRAVDLGAAGKDNLFGSGRLNLGAIPDLWISSVSITTPGNDNTPTFTWSAATGVSYYEVRMDAGGWSNVGSATSYTWATPLSDGTHTFDVRASDASGNKGVPGNVAFSTDTIPPSVPSGLTKTTPDNNNKPTFTWNIATDAIAYEVSVDSAAYLTIGNVLTYTAPLSLADGTHTFAARSKDAGGNTSAASTLIFTIDTIPPTAPGSFVRTTSSTNTTPSFAWTVASDTGSGVDFYQVAQEFWDWTNIGNVTTYTWPSSLGYGTYNVKVRATDKAGNTGTAASLTFTLSQAQITGVGASPAFFNPALGSVGVSFTLSLPTGETSEVKLEVVNSSNNIVRTVDGGIKGPGSYTLMWDGKTDYGVAVGEGTYFLRLLTGGATYSGVSIQWGIADQGRLDNPEGVAIDSSGNIYVVDAGNDRIQRFSSPGAFLSFSSSDPGKESSSYPAGISIDGVGNIYVTDISNNRVKKFSPSGTFLGNLGEGQVQLASPFGVAVDSAGNVYVLDTSNRRVQKLSSSGEFLTMWGTDGNGEGQFNFPEGIAVDSSGNVYVADTGNHRVQKFSSTGVFLAKWGSYGVSDGQLNFPARIAVDSSGNIFVTEVSRVQKFSGTGSFLLKWGGTGTADGQFQMIKGAAVDAQGNVYVSDRSNNRVQKFSGSGVFLGKFGHTFGSEDGLFNSPRGVATDNAGNVYVTDHYNQRVQKFSNSGAFLSKWGWFGSGDGEFNRPWGITVDASGNVYVVDSENHNVQKFSSSGTFLGKWGSFGSGDGQFNLPKGVAVDAAGNVYVADYSNHRIQKFSSSGVFLANWGAKGAADGQFNEPAGVAVDGSGNVYVADTSNNRVQKFSNSGGFITKWGMSASPWGIAVDKFGKVYVPGRVFDASGLLLRSWVGGAGPYSGITVDALGFIYVTDATNHLVRKFAQAEASTVVDTTLPSLPANVSKTTPDNQSTPAFAWGASSDSASGIGRYDVRVDTGAWANAGEVTGYTWPTALADGSHIFSVRSVDKAGNMSAVATLTFTIDATPPTTPTSLSKTTADNNNKPAFTWTASTDTTSGIDYHEVKIDSGTWTNIGNLTTYTWPTALADGSHTFNVRAVDKAANTGTSASLTFTIDTVAPTTPTNLSKTTPDNNNKPSFTWTASTDATSGIDYYEAKMDAGSWANIGNVTTYTWPSAITDGSHTVNLRAVDKATNTGSATSITFTIDATPPTKPANLVRTTSDYNTKPAFTWTASTDATTGVDYYEIRLDSGTWVNIGNVTSYTWQVSISTGNHNLNLRAVDKAGNAGTPENINFNILPNQSPVAVISTPQNGSSFFITDNISFNGSQSSDPDGDTLTYEWSSSKDGFLGATATLTKQLTAGSHTVSLKVSDGKGGQNTVSITITVKTQKALDVTWGSHNTPASIKPGQIVEVSISLTNTGTQTWSKSGANAVYVSYHWYNSSWQAVEWGIGMWSALPNDVASGQTVNVTAVLKAPSTAGSYNLLWDAIQQGVTWFSATGSQLGVATGITVAATQARDAQWISHSTPTNIKPGQIISVPITIINTGSQTWSKSGANPVYVSYHWYNTSWQAVEWGVGLRSSFANNVPTGQNASITASLKAPSTPGSYNLLWDVLQEGVAWFSAGGVQVGVSSGITVAATQARDIQWTSLGTTTNIKPGQIVTVPITITNTGSQTWSKSGANGVYVSYHWYNSSWQAVEWGIGMWTALPNDVATGQSVSINALLKAPSAPGSYNLLWDAIQQGVAWFSAGGAPLGVASGITVAATQARDVQWTSHSTPSSIQAGQIVGVLLTLTNIGSQTWSKSGANPVFISYHWYNASWQAVEWGIGMWRALPNDVATGQNISLTAALKAPTTSGTYNLLWDVVQQNVAWFSGDGAPLLAVPSITVSP